MTYYVSETATGLRLSIFYTVTTCNIKANITLTAAPYPLPISLAKRCQGR